jgi:dTDP-4-dehydrorhamnose 3,5-epimerase-like enzyme
MALEVGIAFDHPRLTVAWRLPADRINVSDKDKQNRKSKDVFETR